MKRAAIALWAMSLGLPAAAPAANVEGSVAFARRVEMAFPVSGVIDRVDVATGQRVSKGQLLAKLDETPFRSAVEQGEAELSIRMADQREAARDARQAQELFDRSVLSSVELENAKNKSLRADATLKDARARLASARYAYSRSQLIAPFDGWVLEVRAVPGTAVVSALEARPQIVLVAQGEYLVRARLPVGRLAGIAVGSRVSVQVGAGRYAGTVQSVGLEPAVGRETGENAMHDVVVHFQSADVLRPGQNARLELP